MHRLLSAAIDAAAAAVFLVPLLLWLHRRQPPLRRALLILCALYAAAVFSVVGLPSISLYNLDFSFNLIPFVQIAKDAGGYFKNFLLNILLFIPIGLFCFLLWPSFRQVWRGALLGLALSGFIELAQLFTFRLTDVDDLIANAAGAALGCLLARRMPKGELAPSGQAREGKACAGLFALTAAVMMTVQPYAAGLLWSLFL